MHLIVFEIIILNTELIPCQEFINYAVAIYIISIFKTVIKNIKYFFILQEIGYKIHNSLKRCAMHSYAVFELTILHYIVHILKNIIKVTNIFFILLGFR